MDLDLYKLLDSSSISVSNSSLPDSSIFLLILSNLCIVRKA